MKPILVCIFVCIVVLIIILYNLNYTEAFKSCQYDHLILRKDDLEILRELTETFKNYSKEWKQLYYLNCVDELLQS